MEGHCFFFKKGIEKPAMLFSRVFKGVRISWNLMKLIDKDLADGI